MSRRIALAVALAATVPMLVGPVYADSCLSRSRFVSSRGFRSSFYHDKVIEPVAVFVPSYTAVLAPYSVSAPAYAPPSPAPVVNYQAPTPIYNPPPPVAATYAPAPCAQPCAPAAAPGYGPELVSVLREIQAGMQADRQRICGIEAKLGIAPPVPPAPVAPPAPPQPAPPPPAPQQMPPANDNAVQALDAGLTKCAVCHSDAAQQGRGFRMFAQGKLENLTDAQLKAIVKRVSNDSMPPAGSQPLAASEKAAILQAFAGR